MEKRRNQGDVKSRQKENKLQKKQRRLQKKDFCISLTGKHVFGAYFNMARTNLIKTLNYILPIVGVRGNYSESQFDKMLHALFLIQSGRNEGLTVEQKQWEKKLRLNPEQQIRLQKLLFKHFPVLGPIMADVADHKAYLNKKNKKKSEVQSEEETFEQLKGVSLADCLEMLCLMAETLTECRNYFTHKDPYNTPEQLADQYFHQQKISKKLDKVVVASRRILKNREGLSVNEFEFLTGIDHLYQDVVKDESGCVKKKNGKELKAFVEYDDFYFKISKKLDKNYTIKGENGQSVVIDTVLSDFGLLYFCVLFLSKPYAKLFIEETQLFDSSPFSENENMIMSEMLSVYRIRTPRLHKIDSRDNKAALAMDIFGELRRCPIELYDLLDKNNGQPFFHDEVKRPNSQTPEVSKRLRYGDRFPTLALRYIDETELFKRIRFQLQLGAFRYKFYDKANCVDGITRVRCYQKDINGYGRLQEVADKRMEKWGDLIQKREEKSVKLEYEELYIDLDQFPEDTADSTPYITDRRPTYNIHANRIGLFWEDSQNPKEFTLFDERGMYIPELLVTEDEKAPIKMPAPRCALSVYDLPAMLFYEYLCKKKNVSPSAEQIIINYEAEYHRFFNSVAEGTLTPFQDKKEFCDYLKKEFPKLRMADIPQKIQLYLSGKELSYGTKRETVRQRMVRLAVERLEERKARVQRRLDHYNKDRNKIGEKDNKYGKKDFSDVRHGSIASYLSKNMMEWQPSIDGEGKDKLTGMNFNVLTGYLATYGSPQAQGKNVFPKTLEEVLADAHLIGSGNPHPFLREVLNHTNRNIEEFYLNYLREELKHTSSIIQALQSDASDEKLAGIPFIHSDRARFRERTEEEMRALAARYTTIQLPDGLFTPFIIEILQKHYSEYDELQKPFKQDLPSKTNPSHNAAYLISLFYKTVLKDDAQPFYISDKTYVRNIDGETPKNFSFKRAYELFSVLRNKKEETFPYELIPLFMTCDEIQTRLSAKRLDESNKPMAELRKNGKDAKDEQGNVIWQRQINRDIQEYVYSLNDRDLKISFGLSKKEKEKEREDKCKALINRLTRQIGDIKNNERTLRRYKTQDMVLFLLAKEMFVNIITEQGNMANWNQMRLSEVCNDDFLRQTLTFRVSVAVGDKTVYVEQENMSLKNYGEFYRFLTDDRLMSLLKNIVGSITPNTKGELVIRHTDLMSELASYDQKRSTVFELIQQIEGLIIEKNENLKNPETDEFWVRDGFPKRNNFAAMLALLDKLNDKDLTDNERKLLVAVRNAFCHNSYNIDLTLIEDVKHLPEVANGILKYLTEKVGNQDKNN